MKKWIIILVVLVALAAGIAIGYGSGRSPRPAPPEGEKPVAISPTASPIPTVSPAATRTVVPTAPPPAKGTTVPAPPRPPTPVATPAPATPPPAKDVRFTFALGDITGSGFTRTVTAQLTNTGSVDAHNVWAKVEVFSQRSRISLGGSDSLRIDVGTLRAGETVSKQVDITFNLFDGMKIAQNGAQFVVTIISDENTQTFSYDYAP